MQIKQLQLILKARSIFKHSQGFLLVEVLVSVFIISLLALGLVGSIAYGVKSTSISGDRSRAVMLAEEGLEASRNIRDANFANLVNGTYGLSNSGGQWGFSGVSDVTSKFTRTITISTVDSVTKQVVSTVSWLDLGSVPRSTVLTTYFTDWSVGGSKGGMLVYGNGTTTSDSMLYTIFNANNNTWSTPASVADIDAGTTNRYARAIRVYSSSTRNEKVLLSRHYDGTTQYIYAQVYNGSSWGNVQLLASWSASTFLNVQNFDGTYLNNGDFVVIYSDNTATPKTRTWNGSSWSTQTSLTSLGTGEIPNYIIAKARPSTNEIMAAFFTQLADTITEYYSGSAWSAVTSHATAAANTNSNFIDFAWSSNTPTTGDLVYSAASGDKNITHRLWVANGSGSGSWGTAKNGPGLGHVIVNLQVTDRPGADEFHACTEDTTAAPKIYCEKVAFSGSTPTLIKGVNSPLGTTDNGIQLAYGLGFERNSGTPAILVYSGTTSTPKYKKYTASTNTWDASATSITAVSGVVKTVRVMPKTNDNDMLILIADANRALYSIMWDGTNNLMYSTPASKALSSQGTNGSAITDYWYDFAWDLY